MAKKILLLSVFFMSASLGCKLIHSDGAAKETTFFKELDGYYFFWDLHETGDGNLLAAVFKNPFKGNSNDLSVIKLNLNGVVLWIKDFKNVYADKEAGFADINILNDGSYLAVFGQKNGDEKYTSKIIKLSPDGSIILEKEIARDLGLVVTTAAETSDGDILVGGTVFTDNRYRKIWIGRLKKNAEIEWEKVLDSGKAFQFVHDIRADKNGNIVIKAVCEKNGRNLWLIKMDSSGNIIWENTHGLLEDDVASSESLYLADDGKITTLGYQILPDKRKHSTFLEFDNMGNLLSETIVDKKAQNILFSIFPTLHNTFICCGITANDRGILYELDKNGKIIREKIFSENEFIPFSFIALKNGGYIAGGFKPKDGAEHNTVAWVWKLSNNW